ncbi:MAG: hypothetical protein U0P45_15100 [Acidimicrobiales bacterium]
MDQIDADRPARPRPVRAHEGYDDLTAEPDAPEAGPEGERARPPAPKPARHWLDRR